MSAKVINLDEFRRRKLIKKAMEDARSKRGLSFHLVKMLSEQLGE